MGLVQWVWQLEQDQGLIQSFVFVLFFNNVSILKIELTFMVLNNSGKSDFVR